jgi:hypothetical protein
MTDGQKLIRRVAAGFILFNLVIVIIVLRPLFEADEEKSSIPARLTNQTDKLIKDPSSPSGTIEKR